MMTKRGRTRMLNGHEFSYLDLSKITLVRFTWMQGWLDVWLDDVRFYRHALSAQQTP